MKCLTIERFRSCRTSNCEMARREARDSYTIDFSFVKTIETRPRAPRVKFPLDPVWTKNKAKLIAKYLFEFVFVTHHGTYIDGFAGPQRAGKPNTWAAKLVLENTPKWLRHFYLFDKDPKQIERLERLKDSQPPPDKEKNEPERTITVKLGDANSLITEVLQSSEIRQTEATFCLLDQRNIECEWSTLSALSNYKQSGNKIELLYFLASAWLDRALKNRRKNQEAIAKWWGGDDWQIFENMSRFDRAQLFVYRFKKELGYWSATALPIFADNSPSRVMFYMIHATDHPLAPTLMARAYRKALQPETAEQVQIEIDQLLKTPLQTRR